MSSKRGRRKKRESGITEAKGRGNVKMEGAVQHDILLRVTVRTENGLCIWEIRRTLVTSLRKSVRAKARL